MIPTDNMDIEPFDINFVDLVTFFLEERITGNPFPLKDNL